MLNLLLKTEKPEGGVLGESSGMDFLVASEGPQLTKGAVALRAHIVPEPRVCALVNA